MGATAWAKPPSSNCIMGLLLITEEGRGGGKKKGKKGKGEDLAHGEEKLTRSA